MIEERFNERRSRRHSIGYTFILYFTSYFFFSAEHSVRLNTRDHAIVIDQFPPSFSLVTFLFLVLVLSAQFALVVSITILQSSTMLESKTQRETGTALRLSSIRYQPNGRPRKGKGASTPRYVRETD